MSTKHNVLFLCTGNSCRSQMAEGFLRHYASNRFDVFSAGTDPAKSVHPLAVQVMQEKGIDISTQRPKGVKEYMGKLLIRYLIIVCSDADESCPRIFPGVLYRLFWPFDDPARMEGNQEQVLAGFRRVRDEVDQQIRDWLPTA
jgi:arsenate reductase (thioredoxin)